MKWSINIGKIAGIDLKIHLTFFDSPTLGGRLRSDQRGNLTGNPG